MQPKAELVVPAAMGAAERDELWQFFSPMVNRPREQFEQGLATFPELRIWRHPQTGQLLGFSASRWLEVEVAGQPVDVAYVGWVALAPELRSSGVAWRDAFTRNWKKALLRRGRPGYLIFGASTFKSYRSLLRYAPAAWPQQDRPMPPQVAAAVEAVMNALGEEHYDADAGVIRRFGAQRYLEGVYADTPDVLADPMVAYYAARNPRQHEGDTLLIAYELSWRNVLWFGLRLLRPKPAAPRREALQ